MRFPTYDQAEQLKQTWTDRYVRVKPQHEHYKRFEGQIGRVVTVNYGGRAIIDFADGAWYDVPASEEFLEIVPNNEVHGKYDSTVNSAQKFPTRQG